MAGKAEVAKSAIFAFNTNIDAVWKVDQLVERTDLPEEMLPLFEAMRSGESGEVRIGRKTAEFIRRSFPFGERRGGGQAGNAANAAAKLGVRAALHVANLTGTQRMVMECRVECIGDASGESSVHYVFEFSKGQELLGISIPESGRLIFTHDPANEEMKVSTAFKKFTLKHAREFECALVSGFHNLREEGCEHKLAEIAGLMRLWKKVNPRMRVHVEFGDFASEDVLRLVLRRILPYADSLGMNELELRGVASVLGAKGRDEFAVAEKVFAELPYQLGGMVVHEKAYSFAFSRKKQRLEPKMLFGHALAGFKAAKGRNAGFVELRHFLSQKHPVSQEGIAALEKFNGHRFANAVLVPALAVKPKFTVGLGDAYATGWLLLG